jgi:hypothetical protein
VRHQQQRHDRCRHGPVGASHRRGRHLPQEVDAGGDGRQRDDVEHGAERVERLVAAQRREDRRRQGIGDPEQIEDREQLGVRDPGGGRPAVLVRASGLGEADRAGRTLSADHAPSLSRRRLRRHRR